MHPPSRPRASKLPPRSRWRLAVAMTFWLGLLGLAIPGCAPGQGQGDPGVLVVFQEQQPSWIRNFNPLGPAGSYRWVTKAGMYEPLMIWNPLVSRYVPWLALEYRWSDDQTELSFQLRPGVEWSDGTPFTAEDVQFTFELLRDHKALDQYGVWKFIEKVETHGPLEVRFRFRRPFTPGIYYIAHQQALVPKHIWQTIPDPLLFANEHPVATGPFTRIEEFRDQVFQVGRNPRWWNKQGAQFKAMRFPALAGNDQSTLALLRGDVHWSGNFVPAIDRVFVAKDPAHHHYWNPLVQGSEILYANTTRPPFDDRRVRKALSMAIDRELLVRVALHGYSRPADTTGLSDAYRHFHSPEAAARGRWTEYDPKAANRLLDEAGLVRGPDDIRRTPDGRRLSYEINVVTGWSDYLSSAQLIARGYRAIGVEARIKTHDFGTWYAKLQTGDFDLALAWSEEGPSPYALYRGLMSTSTQKPIGEPSARNWQRYASKAADPIFAEIEATSDPERLAQLYDQLQAIFVEEVPAIPLYPTPSWGQYNDRQITGFPHAEHPYGTLTPHKVPQSLLVLERLRAR